MGRRDTRTATGPSGASERLARRKATAPTSRLFADPAPTTRIPHRAVNASSTASSRRLERSRRRRTPASPPTTRRRPPAPAGAAVLAPLGLAEPVRQHARAGTPPRTAPARRPGSSRAADVEPFRLQRVLDLDPDRERVPGLRVQHVAERHPVGGAADRPPVDPQQRTPSVQGASTRPDTPSPIESTREAVEALGAAGAPGAQRGAHLGDDRPLPGSFEHELPAGRRFQHHGRTTPT